MLHFVKKHNYLAVCQRNHHLKPVEKKTSKLLDDKFTKKFINNIKSILNSQYQVDYIYVNINVDKLNKEEIEEVKKYMYIPSSMQDNIIIEYNKEKFKEGKDLRNNSEIIINLKLFSIRTIVK